MLVAKKGKEMDTLTVVYIVASLFVIIFQFWYIQRLRRCLEFVLDALKRYASAILKEDTEEIERIDNDVKNFK